MDRGTTSTPPTVERTAIEVVQVWEAVDHGFRARCRGSLLGPLWPAGTRDVMIRDVRYDTTTCRLRLKAVRRTRRCSVHRDGRRAVTATFSAGNRQLYGGRRAAGGSGPPRREGPWPGPRRWPGLIRARDRAGSAAPAAAEATGAVDPTVGRLGYWRIEQALDQPRKLVMLNGLGQRRGD